MKNKIVVIGILMLVIPLLCGCTEEIITTEHIDTITLAEGESYTIPDTYINITMIGASSGFWKSGCSMTLRIECKGETNTEIIYYDDNIIIYGYTIVYKGVSDYAGTFEVRR